MEKRRLGKTNHESTVVIFGGAALWDVSQQEADDAIALAREYGVNHFDIAPQYGKAQELVGPWLAEYRNEVFLGCKTLERTRQGAWGDLQNSFKLMQVSHFDLYQFHSVGRMEDLDSIFAPGGALEAVLDARDKGLLSHLGITGHGDTAPRVHIAALERFDFATVMTPYNYILAADPGYRADFLELSRSRRRGMLA